MFRIVVSFLAIMAVATALGLLLVLAIDLLLSHDGDDIARVDPHIAIQFAASLI